MAHNNAEHFYHPDNYKMVFCKDYGQGKNCAYGSHCSFAHFVDELRITLIEHEDFDDNFIKYKFKTVFCPYLSHHDKSECVYAHNIQDLRREPTIYNYRPEDCKGWERQQHTRYYEDGKCLLGRKCDKCHGRYELEYHPINFKK